MRPSSTGAGRSVSSLRPEVHVPRFAFRDLRFKGEAFALDGQDWAGGKAPGRCRGGNPCLQRLPPLRPLSASALLRLPQEDAVPVRQVTWGSPTPSPLQAGRAPHPVREAWLIRERAPLPSCQLSSPTCPCPVPAAVPLGEGISSALLPSSCPGGRRHD